MQIIVWNDKHGTSYYDASTTEALDASSIEILKSLTDERYGYWREYEPWVSDENKRLAAIDLTGADPAILAELEKKVTRAQREVQRGIDDARERKETIALAKSYIEAGKSPIVSRGSGRYERKVPAAWLLIVDNSGGEYEDIQLETVFTAPTEVSDL